MIVEKITKPFEVIMSHGNYGFQEVLDDFSNAECIYIMTYNISEHKEDELLDLLIKYGTFKPVSLVTNIPNRFEEYFSTYKQNEAKKQIKLYKEKLDYHIIGENFNASFDFNNHMKIVMTNNVAYIGSQNFSQESKNNKECGVIIRDKNEINNLINWLNTYISEKTIRYTKESIRILHDNLTKIYDKIQDDIYQVFGNYEGTLGDYIKLDKTNPNKLFELQDLHQKLDSYYQIISQVCQKYSDEYSIEINSISSFINKLEENISNLSKHIIDYDLMEFLEFDLSYYENKISSDINGLEIWLESLDNHRNTFENCTDNFIYISKALENIKKEMRYLIHKCEQILNIYERYNTIDNTK